ncbi:uncharacterized protein EV420DRAFT_746977 [Desarmillaria tabescens]|uniref:BTB domain-containing protein n=1 Tax=Armillaria tabescens TaxID=1929756 RepID=A0AA39JX89_ARMTA|nr:uncharacterized protein EV420DRAFT_746977 [Desarmillaria tabescens]KAK0450297.1 hypothetical protein EV420DRAFT_746977 [Desarmillaria tabescens]
MNSKNMTVISGATKTSNHQKARPVLSQEHYLPTPLSTNMIIAPSAQPLPFIPPSIFNFGSEAAEYRTNAALPNIMTPSSTFIPDHTRASTLSTSSTTFRVAGELQRLDDVQLSLRNDNFGTRPLAAGNFMVDPNDATDAILTMFNTPFDVEECGTTQTALQGLPGGMTPVSALRGEYSMAGIDLQSNGLVGENNMTVPATVWLEGCDKAGTGVTFQYSYPETISFPPKQASADVKAISTKFNKNFKHHNYLPDIQLVSSDSVLFEVHYREIIIASTNAFNKLLEHHTPCVSVQETSEMLNIILHAIYGISCSQFRHTIDHLITAVRLFPKYGLEPKAFVSPSSPLFDVIRFQMPLSPLEVYVVASNYGLEELATAASSHLLSFKIGTMSTEMAQLINPVYLKRLFDLQTTRVNTLKRALSIPPAHHSATPTCDFIAQKSLTRAWALCAAYLGCSANAGLLLYASRRSRTHSDVFQGITASRIENVFRAFADRYLSCDECKGCLKGSPKKYHSRMVRDEANHLIDGMCCRSHLTSFYLKNTNTMLSRCGASVMDVGVFSNLSTSQHMPALGLLGLDLGLPVFSLIFSYFLYSSC